MLADAAIFVSKRLQRACVALVCLVLMQFALALTGLDRTQGTPPASARIALP
jgi:hypothetical protein